MITDPLEAAPLEVELLVPRHARRCPDGDQGLVADLAVDRPPARRKGSDVSRLLAILDELDSETVEGGMPA